MKRFLVLSAAITGGAFIYQVLQPSPLWSVAVERSFFTISGVIMTIYSWEWPLLQKRKAARRRGF